MFNRVLACTAALFLITTAAMAQAPGLGSPNYKPSPENPVGWRGDWTGRFPAATPPLEWSRRVKGITSELRYQAKKPVGDAAPTAAQQLEYFTIKDWLIAGPFAVDDATDISKDFLGGEDSVQPDVNAKAGTATWQPIRCGMGTQSRHEHNEGTIGHLNVDFVFTYGQLTVQGLGVKLENDLSNKVAYAHTYIWSPADAKVRLQIPFAGTAGKFYLNGKGADLDKRAGDKLYDVTLSRGWNRLLVKVSTAKGINGAPDKTWHSDWRMAAYIQPSGAAGVRDEEHRVDDQAHRPEHVSADRRGQPHLRWLQHLRPDLHRQEHRQDRLAAQQHTLRCAQCPGPPGASRRQRHRADAREARAAQQ